jgi:arsenate reductase
MTSIGLHMLKWATEEEAMSRKIGILIICTHNSARSQIAEAYLTRFAGEHLHIESAGFEPSETVNPLVVEVMKEEGFDLAHKKPRNVFELYRQGRVFSHVITVCHDSEEKCPIFPGVTKRWHQPFPDPAELEGTHEEKLVKVREIRDMIKDWLLNPEDGQFSLEEAIAHSIK